MQNSPTSAHLGKGLQGRGGGSPHAAHTRGGFGRPPERDGSAVTNGSRRPDKAVPL